MFFALDKGPSRVRFMTRSCINDGTCHINIGASYGVSRLDQGVSNWLPSFHVVVEELRVPNLVLVVQQCNEIAQQVTSNSHM